MFIKDRERLPQIKNTLRVRTPAAVKIFSYKIVGIGGGWFFFFSFAKLEKQETKNKKNTCCIFRKKAS
jgi:hypothetical protein